MTSSTSLYNSTPGNANVASQNFTTLYSGSGAINPQQAYGNANVVSLLAVGTDGGNTIGNIIASGNVTADYFIGNVNAANIVGNIAAAGSNTQVQFNNAGVLGADSDFTFNSATSALAVTGNITAGNVVTSGTGLLVGNVFSEVTAGANVAVLTARMATDDTFRILVGGLVDDGFVEIATADAGTEPIYVRQYTGGGGGPFTTLARSLTLLDAAGNTAIPGNTSVVGNVAAAYFIGNGSALTSITGANVTGNVGLAQFVTANAQANITSVGILTALSASGNITGGNVNSLANISAVGNITASYFIGNGSQLTGVAVAAAGANTQVQFNDGGVTNGTAGFTFDKTSNAVVVVGNVTGSNIRSAVFQAVNSAGGALRNASGSNQLQWGGGGGNNVTIDVSTNINGANAQIDISPTGNSGHVHIKPTGTPSVEIAPTYTGSINNMIIGNITPAAVSATTVSASGNIDGGNLRTAGEITATGNITGGNITTGGIVTAAGNVLTGNLIIAPGTGAGNINQVSSQAFATVTTTNNPARIILGSGYTGNSDAWSVDYDPYNRMRQAGVLVNNRVARGDGAINTTGLVNVFQQEFTANVTTGSVRNFAAINFLHVGGGANGYQATPGSPATFVGMNSLVIAGTQGNVAVGNVTMNVATGGIFGVNPQNGASIGNAFGVVGTMQPGGATGNIINAVAFTPWTVLTTGVAPTTVPTNYNVFYNPGTATTYGTLSTINSFRSATNYYAFKNDDAVAQVQLGSLRSYNEFRYDTATTGNITVDKNNAQVQYIAPTANVTIDAYANMVTTLSDGVNTDQEIDTLTILVQQGATPYTVTLPTGATYQYAGNISSVPAVANSRSILTVVAANVAGTVNYFTTVQSDQNTNAPAAGSNTQVQFNDSGTFGATAGMTFDKTSNVMIVAGNINGANLVASANLTSTQQTVVGTANVGTTGNIVMSGKNIATDMLLSPDGGDATTAQRGRVLIGTGFNGNNAHNAIQHRLYVNDSITRSATANNAMQLFASDTQVSLTGNVTGSSFRQQAVAARLRIGGGSAANTINLTLTNASIFSVAALQPNIDVGNASPYLLGNTSVGQAVLNGGFITPAPGSTVTNAYGMIPAVNNATGGIVTNYIGFASQLGLMSGSVTGNVYGVYHGSNATLSTTGIATANAARSAPGYYAFYNADDVAQIKLGSLRAYHEYQYTANTSSTVNIDKNNGQIQYIGLTGNATIGDFQNFVTTASNSVSNINQIDTVTLIIKQGATPYTVTMPTGNVAIKYAGNIQTIGTTANSASMVSITAANVGGSALYMVTIAPEFQ